jgi:hypothetical protein
MHHAELDAGEGRKRQRGPHIVGAYEAEAHATKENISQKVQRSRESGGVFTLTRNLKDGWLDRLLIALLWGKTDQDT